MSLKVKILVIFAVTLIVFIFIQQTLHRTYILPGILDLEDMQATKNSRRPEEALKREFFYLSSLIHGGPAWNDMVVAMQNRETSQHALESTLNNNHIHLMTLVDESKKQIQSKIISPETGLDISWHEISDPPPWVINDRMFNDAVYNDILPTPMGPLMLVSRPITPSSERINSSGIIIIGRFLDPPFRRRIENQTGVSFELIATDTLKRSGAAPFLHQVIEGSRPVYIEKNSELTLATYSLPSELLASPSYMIKTTLPRDIYQKGLKTMKLSTASMLISGILLVIPALILLHMIILKPILILSKHVRCVEKSGDISLRLYLKQNDEIGSLARRFNSLLEKLFSIRAYLLEQSYQSGLSVLTSDIIHHGRNTLMPLIQKTEQMKNTFSALPQDNIRKALDEIDSAPIPPEREKNLNRFLHLSADEMLKAIVNSVQLINDIVAVGNDMERLFSDLEAHSRSKNVSMNIAPAAVIHQALSQLPVHFRESSEIIIDQNVDNLPDVTMESQVLMHVFHAILSHSISFASQRKDGRGRIHILARLEQNGQESKIRFIVENNGPVQDMENIKDMFTRVYAEKNRLTFCSGLHWCSNVVRAMRGELDVINENNQTAFHLILPMGGAA